MATAPRIILASASPRRSQLLSRIGLSFEVIPADIDESMPPGLTPEGIATQLARSKAETISEKFPAAIVIAADTIVVLPGAGDAGPVILNKPADVAEATEMLSRLQGAEHVVITGYCLCCKAQNKNVARHVSSRVRFKPLSAGEIADYIRTGEPMDKAGAYGIQEIGAFLVEAVYGSYTNVVGLPLAEVCDELKLWGAWTPAMLPPTTEVRDLPSGCK